MTKVQRILAIRFSAMGDVAMTVPVIRALMQQHPSIELTILTRKKYGVIFKNIPRVTVCAVDLEGEYKGLWGIYKLAKFLKSKDFDAVADLHAVLRTNILKRLLKGVPFVQIDKGRKAKKALVSGKIFQPLKTTFKRYAEVFDRLGLPIDLSDPEFPKQQDLSKWHHSFKKTSQKALIGIAPFAAHEAKMYPLELTEGLIKELSQTNQIILFGGGQKEQELLSRIEKENDNTFSLAGKASLEEELEVISNLDLMIAMDSGNGHLAAMYGVKVITLWGVTHPYAGFKPFNQPEEYSLLADRNKFPLIPTSIYGNTYPKGYENVIATIKPKDILQKVDVILKTTR